MSDQAANSGASAAQPAQVPTEIAASIRQSSRKTRRSWAKISLIALVVAAPIALAGLWAAVHTFSWMGPLVANSLRATIGKDNVTRLEDFAYAVEDRINQRFKSGDKPKTYWAVPPKAPHPKPALSVAPPKVADEGGELAPALAPPPPAFAPVDPGPAQKQWAAEGDGVWVAMDDPRRPDEPARLFKTLLHPDSSRSWSELFVVAVDLRSVAVMPVMGYQEPRTDKTEAQGYNRPAKIPKEHYGALLGAFNGGFMAEHGNYGVFFDGITFLDPKDEACTLVSFHNGSFAVASWTKIKERREEMRWFRQAPSCMYEDNVMHPFLEVQRSKKWGATLDGNTVIRRSAVGISADGQVLYVGISNHTTAKVMAKGMHHAGASHVAQMDVNWSYPKFVTYELGKDELLHPIALAEGFEFSDRLYLRERSMRDFFYLARLEEVAKDLSAHKPPLSAESGADIPLEAEASPVVGAVPRGAHFPRSN